ncbi:MAG TPA: hypothetical protein VIJ85_07685 [Rhizomicrobium sp.]
MTNPEFRRNLWLELSPRRIVFMVAILGLIFFAAAVTNADNGPASVAEMLYYLIVVLWGARNAGLSVVGEIRDRTWDSQRLSSISAAEMTWGKLFGSTIYNWFGGAICLAVMLVYGFAHSTPVTTLISLVYYVAIGVIAQSAALLASLVAVRRRQRHSRLEVFLYQLIGIAAAIAVFGVWETVDPAGSLITHRKATDFIAWWGATLDARPFLLISLAIFAGWTLLGCYREMRRELKLRNGPFVWLGFLGFMGLYVAGFDALLTQDATMSNWSVVALRLALAATTFGALTYIMVLLEPKDRVLYRWYGAQIASGKIGQAFWGLQGWIMSFFAAALTAVALIAWLGIHDAQSGSQALVASCLGLLTRDVAIFVLFATLPGRRRGDFLVLVTLLALYELVPAILGGLGLKGVLPFFDPLPTSPVWLGPAVIWAEAVAVTATAMTRLAVSEKSSA